MQSLKALCRGKCSVFLPSMLYDASVPLLTSHLHTNEHLNGLNDIIDLQLEIFLSWSLWTGQNKHAKCGRTHTYSHTHSREIWLLFCILMRIISCRLAMADKGTYLCPGPQWLTWGKCPLQRPALIVSEHVVRLIIIIIMGN